MSIRLKIDGRTKLLAAVTLGLVAFVGCSNSSNNELPGAGGASISSGSSTGGAASAGGINGSGGFAVTGGSSDTGGNYGSGGLGNTGGAPLTGGATSTGGTSANAKGSGGTPVTGGALGAGGTSAKGGVPGTGGAPVTGGALGAGGTSAKGNGGASSTGGTSVSTVASGGAPFTGGATGAGGTSAKGGAPVTGGVSSAGSGSGSYSPCPASGACKIMPFGDSITEGMRYDGGYRIELFAKAMAAGQNVTFTGSLSNGPTTVSGMPFPRKNEGRGGATISTGSNQIADKIPSPAFDTSSGGIPNIILLHIGTNDVLAQSNPSDMSKRLGALIDKIIGAAPDALLVVAKIVPFGGSTNPTVKTYNDAIPGLVQTRAATGKHILLADMNTGFDASKMLHSDGVHPNQTGYNFMGDQWYSVIGSLFPKQ